MPTREIKSKIALDGEQQFKKAMRDAANGVKVLNSQQKLAKAQFKQTGDQEKYQAAQTEILKKKIEEQKKAVAAAEAAMKQLAKNGVAENSKQMQDWQIKLNSAQTALVGMETELQNLESSADQAADKTEDLTTELGSIDKKMSIDAAIQGIHGITGALEGAVSKAISLGTALYEAMRDAGSWADDLATQSLVYSLSPQELQQMQYAANLIDTNVETIIGARSKLQRNMKFGNKEIQQEFHNLGVQTMAGGVYRDWQDVLWDTGDALMAMTNEVDRDATAQKLLGRSWQELLPMFTAGRKKYEEVMEEAPTVSDEDIGKLTEMDDAFQKLEAQMEVTKKTILAQLAPAFTELATTVEGVMKKINEYLQTDEGKQKLADLSESITSLFEGLSEIDFGELLDGAKEALDKLNAALKWIKDNKDGIIMAIEGIAITLGTLKISETVLRGLQLIAGLKGLKFGSPFFNTGGGGGGDAGTQAGSDAAKTGGGAAVLKALKTAGGKLLSTIAGPFAFLSAAGAAGAVLSEAAVERDYGDYNRTVEKIDDLAAPTEGASEAMQDLQQSLVDAQEAVKEFSSPENEEGTQPLRDVIAENVEGVRAATEGEGIWNRLDEAAKNAGKTVSQVIQEGNITANYEEWLLLTTKYVAALGDQIEEAKTKGTEIGDGASEGLKETAPAVEEAGEDVGAAADKGVEAGIDAGLPGVVKAAQRVGGAAISAMRAVMQIHSPSKVMAELGGYVSEGFAEGITGGLDMVRQAAMQMAGAVSMVPQMPSMRAGIAGAAGSVDGRMIDVTLMIGPEKLTEILVPLVDSSLGEIVSLDRR